LVDNVKRSKDNYLGLSKNFNQNFSYFDFRTTRMKDCFSKYGEMFGSMNQKLENPYTKAVALDDRCEVTIQSLTQ
jgi:hypothetical protein